MRSLATIALVLSTMICLGGQDMWLTANQAYSEGNYEEAVKWYQEIVDSDQESSALYFNLGNALYKLDNIGQAVLNYERALKLDPSDEDARYNLQLANLRTSDRVEPIPELFVSIVWRKVREMLSASGWAIVTLGLLWFAFAIAVWHLFAIQIGIKRVTMILALLLLIGSLIAFVPARQSYLYTLNSGYGVLLSASSYVKSEPSESSKDLFIIHEGIKVEILERSGNWMNLRLADGKQGWALSVDFEEI
jgi:tetratricopeptide (TPR) repeat protein